MAFVSNIKVGDTTNGVRAVAIPSGQVDSTSTSTAFTATIPGITELKNGVCVFLKNGVVTSASGCTLNINGLGAKPIYNTMAAATAVSTTFNSGYTMLFVYDETRVSGGCWMMYYGYNSSGYTSNVAQGQCYGTCSTAVGTAAKTVSMSSYALVAHGICAIKFTNGNTAANPTLNINSKGAKAIYWNGAACPTNLIKPNDVVIMMYSTQYHIVGIYNGNRGFATTTPIMDGTGAIGSSTEYARADHVHPTDTSRAPVESPAFTGTPTAPTPTAGISSTIVANTGWVQGEIADALGDISGAMHFKGRALQTLTDGGTENAASSVAGSTYLGDAGDVYLQYNSADNIQAEFVWNGNTWEELGNETLIHHINLDDYGPPTTTTKNGVTTLTYNNVPQSFIIQEILSYYIAVYDFTGSEILFYPKSTVTMGSFMIIPGTIGFAHQIASSFFQGQAAIYNGEDHILTIYIKNFNFIESVSEEFTLMDGHLSLNYTPPTATALIPGIMTLGSSGGAATYEHTHGNISNTGTMSATASVSPGDKIVIGQNTTGALILGPEFSTVTTNFLNQAGSFTPLPTASTSNAGIVQLGTSSTTAAQGNHTHGNITSDGAVTTTVTVASSDRILITDNSDSSKVKGGPAFNTASTTYFLNAAGSWTVPVGDHKVTQAAAITTSGNYPILLGNTTATTAITATVNKASTLVYNPSTKKLLVNSATVATVADIPTWTVS